MMSRKLTDCNSRRARLRVRQALQSGTILPQPCEAAPCRQPVRPYVVVGKDGEAGARWLCDAHARLLGIARRPVDA